jgi:hypothetical protein
LYLLALEEFAQKSPKFVDIQIKYEVDQTIDTSNEIMHKHQLDLSLI